MNSKIARAPWTREQLGKLIERQDNPMMHEYTCAKCGKDLIPTPNGWACEGLVDQIQTCDYTQDWCLKADLD